MDKLLKIKRGLDLRIEGAVEGASVETRKPSSIAVVPDDFPGFIPKVEVKEGESITQGQPIAGDKNHQDIKLCSPVTGTVRAVVRGERRKVERIVITPDDTPSPSAPASAIEVSPEKVAAAMKQHGLWVAMRQRPYDIVPSPDRVPRDIFVTAIDSAPLAVPIERQPVVTDENLEAGVKALSLLTPGKVWVATRASFSHKVPQEAEHITVEGPHPAGNAGIIAANLAPVNKGETIWTLDIVILCRLGQLMLTGRRGFDTVVALTGPEVKIPSLIATVEGADMESLLKGNLKETDRHIRVISGNILTGVKVREDGYLRFPYRQVTVMAEGDDVDEFMGWASMSPSKMSVSRSFPLSALRGRFSPDARILGGHRALIMSGEMDKVLPMDILPEYLLKAIMSGDIDKMEALGIYEVAPEDFALCEYVDPSKTEIQKIVRQGLDRLRKEIE